jgi:hypothetical protein
VLNQYVMCDGECTPQAGLMVEGVSRDPVDGFAEATSTDAGPCTLDLAMSNGQSQSIDIFVQDESGSEPRDATNLKNWLGGTDFSITVLCGGMQVAQLQGQSMGQNCNIDD